MPSCVPSPGPNAGRHDRPIDVEVELAGIAQRVRSQLTDLFSASAKSTSIVRWRGPSNSTRTMRWN